MRSTAKLLGRILRSDVLIDLQIDDAAPSVVADPSQIGQVLLNLAVNAQDAMPEGGTLSLSVGRLSEDQSWTAYPGVEPREYCRIHVSDTGVGMSEATVARIFQPFFTSVLGEGTAFEILLPAAGTQPEHRTEPLPFRKAGRAQPLPA